MFSISGFRNEAFKYNEEGYCEVLADVHKSIFSYFLFQIFADKWPNIYLQSCKVNICTKRQPNISDGNNNIYILCKRYPKCLLKYLQGLSKVFFPTEFGLFCELYGRTDKAKKNETKQKHLQYYFLHGTWQSLGCLVSCQWPFFLRGGVSWSSFGTACWRGHQLLDEQTEPIIGCASKNNYWMSKQNQLLDEQTKPITEGTNKTVLGLICLQEWFVSLRSLNF